MIADLLPDEEPQTACPAREKVLIVDDDPMHIDIMRHGLENQGFEVFSATTANDLFDRIQTNRPDVIVLDICLPDGNGLEICKELSDAPATISIPVIILSGSTEDSVVRQARAAGCRFFLSKPFDPNAILLVIRQAIDE
jgi:CheY-like chemotaxis protein